MFRYLLPALIPSWRFFDYIRSSPRIEFAVVAQVDDPATLWQEFRPRPVHLSVAAMLRRLLWNPIWNESLYMVSCAEKLLDEPIAMREDELLTRITATVPRGESGDKVTGSRYLMFRIVVIKRYGGQITRRVDYISSVRRLGVGGLSAT
jgi:hypothetical protein